MSSSCTPPSGNGTFLPIPPGSPAHTNALATIILFTIYVFISIAVFQYYKPTSAILRKRRTRHILISAAAAFCVLGFTAVYDYVGADRFPCILLLLLFHLGNLPLASIPLIMKMVMYTNQISVLRVARLVQQQKRQLEQQQGMTPRGNGAITPRESSMQEQHTTPRSSELSKSSSTRAFGGGIVRTVFNSHKSNLNTLLQDGIDPYHIEPSATCQTYAAYIRFVVNAKRWRTTATVEDRVLKLQFMKSNTYIALWIFFASIGGLITVFVRIATDENMRNNCTGCVLLWSDLISAIVITFWGQLVGPCTVPANGADHLGILHEFRHSYRSSLFSVVGFLLYMFVPGVQYNFINFCLVPATICMYLCTWHQVLQSRFSKKVLQSFSAEECFAEVEANQEMKSMFRKFLDAELSPEIYWFMDAVDAYKRVGRNEEEDAHEEAMGERAVDLYEKYVKPWSEYEVNLNGALRNRVTRRIAARDYSLDMFDEAVQEVKTSMLRDGFLRFISSLDAEEKASLVTFVEA